MKPAKIKFKKFISDYILDKKIHYYFILAIIPALLYAHTISFGYTGFDDEEIIGKKTEFLQKPENLPQAFKRDAFMNTKGDSFYRPMGNISFMIDAIIGGSELSVFHAHNLLLHIVSLMLGLYFFVLLGLNKQVSFYILLIFSVHPLFTHAVCWLPSRMDLLLAVFMICTFITFIKYVESSSILYAVLHFVFFFLAVFSKETALILPLILGVYYYLLKSGNYKKNGMVFITGWAIIIIAFIVMRFQVLRHQEILGYFTIPALLRNLQTIPTMLAKFVLPVGLTTMPRFQLTFTLLGILLMAGIVLILLNKKEKGGGLLLFGCIWYILITLPPLFYINPASEFGFDYLEHRAYVPMLGIGIFIAKLIGDRKLTSGVWKTAIPIIVFLLAAITYSNSYNYASTLDFFSAAIKENAQCAMAFNSRSMYKFSIGDVIGAENDLNASLAITPNYAPAWNNKGALFLQRNQYDSAIVCLNKAISLNPQYSDAFVNRAIARTNLHDVSGAISDYCASLRIDSGEDYVYYNLGNLYATVGNFKEAVKQYSKAIDLNLKYYEAFNNRANLKIKFKDFDGAIEDCNRVMELKPDYPRAYYNQAKAFWGKGMQAEALRTINYALQLDSTYQAAIELQAQIIQLNPR
jgi:tetratricopeptide (TPR) repeat protein